MPTLLDAVHLPAPADVDGISLLRGIPEGRAVFAETAQWLNGKEGAPPGAMAYPPILDLIEVEEGSHALVLKRKWFDRTVTAKLRALRKGPWELIYTPTDRDPLWKLVDLSRDPYGQRDLSKERPEVLVPLQRELKEFLRQDRLRWLDAQDRVVARIEQ